MKTDRDQSNEPMDNELHELFLDELADMYDAERQLIKALPKLAEAAESDQLREAFESHLEETENHVKRIEQVFASVSARPQNNKCEAMKGLVEESDEILGDWQDSAAVDAALISAAQKVEHYEIASYCTLIAWADEMGHEQAVELLKQNLAEEKAADAKLAQLATTFANQRAEHAT